MYSVDLTDFEITIPELVDFEGNHISHHLSRERGRRSVSGSVATSFLGLKAHGHDFRVLLEENPSLLSPTFAVKRVRRNVFNGELEEIQEKTSGLDCHYTGRMVSHQNHTTGLSVCGGKMVSLLNMYL